MAIFQVLCSLCLQGKSIGFGGIEKQSLEKLVPMSDQSLQVNYALHLEKWCSFRIKVPFISLLCEQSSHSVTSLFSCSCSLMSAADKHAPASPKQPDKKQAPSQQMKGTAPNDLCVCVLPLRAVIGESDRQGLVNMQASTSHLRTCDCWWHALQSGLLWRGMGKSALEGHGEERSLMAICKVAKCLDTLRKGN